MVNQTFDTFLCKITFQRARVLHTALTPANSDILLSMIWCWSWYEILSIMLRRDKKFKFLFWGIYLNWNSLDVLSKPEQFWWFVFTNSKKKERKKRPPLFNGHLLDSKRVISYGSVKRIWNVNISERSLINYMFKVNNINTRTRCKMCLKLTIETPEQRHGFSLTRILTYTGQLKPVASFWCHYS